MRPKSAGLDYERLHKKLRTDVTFVWRFGVGRGLLRKQIHRSKELEFHIQQQAQGRAAQAARSIPWRVLLEARHQYLEWQEFYYWARSIMESEECIPSWLARKLDEMCPGFLSAEKQYSVNAPTETVPAPIRLGQWIDEHIFGFAQQAGWLPAITYYAVRESRYQGHQSAGPKRWRNGVRQNRPNTPH